MEVIVHDARGQTGEARQSDQTIAARGMAPARVPGESTWRDYQLLLLLIAFVAGVRVWLICHTEVAARDSIGYIRYGLELEKEPWADVFRHSLQHPGYPMVIQVVSHPVRYFMGGLSPLSMQVSAQAASALASLLLIIPTFYLGRELFDRKTAFWATFLFACLPGAARVMSDGLSEATFFLFLACALLMGIRALRTASAVRFACCGLFSGLAYLTRPEGMLVVVAVGLVLLAMQAVRSLRRTWKRTALSGASLGLAALLVGGPFASTIGGFTTKPTPNKLLDLNAAPNKNTATIAHDPKADQRTTSKTRVEVPSMTTSLLAVYAPTRLQHRTLWSVKAIGIETAKGYQYVLALPLLLGLWLYRKPLGASAAGWVLLVLCNLHAVVLWRLAMVMGYISDRHVLLLIFCGIYPAAAGCMAGSEWLASTATSLWRWYRGTAVTSRQVSSVALVLLIAMTAFSLPEVLKPMHANRSGHREAGEWLAEHAQPGDRIIDPFCWAHYFAGRVFLEGKNLEPTPINYVITERADHEHVRLPMLAISEEYARFGTPVYHWPESKPEVSAKVIVYRVTEQDVENAKKHWPAQYTPQSSRRTSSLADLISSNFQQAFNTWLARSLP